MTDTADDRHRSPWGRRAKVGRVLWAIVAATLFRPSPRPCYRWRNWLLRRFGARVHPSARIRPSVAIEIPWHLTVGADSSVGDHAVLYCLAPVTLGDRETVSQYAHLCAGTHDHTDPTFPLLTPPVVVEDGAWVATDAFVGPGVTVGARATVVKDVPPDEVWAGNPARFIKPRGMSVE